MAAQGTADLAIDLAARLPIELLARPLAHPRRRPCRAFVARLLRMQRGAHWEPKARAEGAGRRPTS